jgi:NAD(P)-dependent dehydrogenase (short-subunit alcohol dehydrogenase family)
LNLQTCKLIGKVALVIGASSAIGEATALALAAEGARVAIAARRRRRLNDLADRIRQGGGEALAIEADVTDEAQALAMVQCVLQDCGRLDMLVNVAASASQHCFRIQRRPSAVRWSTSTSSACCIQSMPRCRR